MSNTILAVTRYVKIEELIDAYTEPGHRRRSLKGMLKNQFGELSVINFIAKQELQYMGYVSLYRTRHNRNGYIDAA